MSDNLFVYDGSGDSGSTLTIVSSSDSSGNGVPQGTSDDYIKNIENKRDDALDDYYSLKQADTTAATQTNIHFENHRVAWDYNLDDPLFHSAFKLEDIVLLDLDTLKNPYDTKVIISDGYAVQATYGDNPAYTEFENLKNEAKVLQDAALKKAEEEAAAKKAEEEAAAKKAEEDNKEFQEKLKQIKSDMDSSSNWTIDPVYVSPQAPMDIHYLPTTVQDSKSQMILNTTGEINRWMAGGDLYDAPRAGDVMFNVAGNLNTVRFLGLQDTNRFPDMVQTFVNPNVSSLFGPMAGDINFSVI